MPPKKKTSKKSLLPTPPPPKKKSSKKSLLPTTPPSKKKLSKKSLKQSRKSQAPLPPPPPPPPPQEVAHEPRPVEFPLSPWSPYQQIGPCGTWKCMSLPLPDQQNRETSRTGNQQARGYPPGYGYSAKTGYAGRGWASSPGSPGPPDSVIAPPRMPEESVLGDCQELMRQLQQSGPGEVQQCKNTHNVYHGCIAFNYNIDCTDDHCLIDNYKPAYSYMRDVVNPRVDKDTKSMGRSQSVPRNLAKRSSILANSKLDFFNKIGLVDCPNVEAYEGAFSDLRARTLQYVDDSDTRKRHLQKDTEDGSEKRRKRICEKADSVEEEMSKNTRKNLKKSILGFSRQARVMLPVMVGTGRDNYRNYTDMCRPVSSANEARAKVKDFVRGSRHQHCNTVRLARKHSGLFPFEDQTAAGGCRRCLSSQQGRSRSLRSTFTGGSNFESGMMAVDRVASIFGNPDYRGRESGSVFSGRSRSASSRRSTFYGVALPERI